MDRGNHVSISISTGTIVRVALVALFFWVLYLVRNIVVVLLTSIVIASFVESAVRRFRKYHFNRTLTAVLVYFTVVVSFGAIIYAFVPILARELSSIVAFLARYFPDSGLLQSLQGNGLSGAIDSLSQLRLGQLLSQGEALASGNLPGFVKVFSALFGGLFNIILVLVISFYLSIQERGIESFLRMVVPLQYEPYVISLWQRTEQKIGLWIQGQLLLGLIVGAVVYAGLLILGVPYALLLALLAGITELIPFGLVLAIVPALVFAYLHGGVSFSLGVGLFYIIVQQIENYLLAPLIVKRVVGISPIVVILALLIGGQMGGFWGILLAIPAAVFILEVINDMEQRKNLTKASLRSSDEPSA